MHLKKNDIVTLTIKGMTSEGSGVGTVDNIAVFVPNTAIGDVVEAKILKVLKKYAFGKIENIITPSSDRIQNECPVFEKCGGCAYRHISYMSEIELKAEQVFHNIKSISKVDFIRGEPLFLEDNICHYRNKAQYPVGVDTNGQAVFGFYAQRSHRVVKNEYCALQKEIFSDIIKDISDFVNKNKVSVYNEEKHKGVLRHIYLRRAEKTGQIMVCFIVNGKTFTGINELSKRLSDKYTDIKSVVLNVNTKKTNVILGDECITVFGKDYIEDCMCGLKIKLSPHSFYQVNHKMAEKLYEKAGELANLKGNETLLDLYCGAGTIGLSLAKKVKNVIGIEVVEQAVKNAKENAKNNNIDNAEFICSDASIIKKLVDNNKINFDVAIVDPPRKGCSQDVLEALVESKAKKIVMISCNSATLARDISFLSKFGYSVGEVIPADLFPRTVHCEAITLLEL